MTDAPIIYSSELSATIEMHDDKDRHTTAVRFAMHKDCNFFDIFAVGDCLDSISHYEQVTIHEPNSCYDVDIPVFKIGMFDAEEVINKMRLIIACYEALSGKVASND
jgi:hypothetical protein